jgi:hypothetical protein
MKDAFLRWLVPPGFQDLLRKWKGDLEAMGAPGAVLAENEKLRDCHKDRKRCFILATGPSIRTQDLRSLKGETCIALSNFCVHPLYSEIRPEYYCVPKLSFPPYTIDDGVRWFTDIDSKMGDAKIFLAVGDRDMVQAHKLFPGKTVHYLGFGRSWDDVESNGIDLTKPLCKVQSAPVIALQVAIFMGFKEIYLLGCDHDHLQHYGVTRHFYEEKEHVIARNAATLKAEWGAFEEELRRYNVLWSQYRALRLWAEPRGIRIFNATPGGLLFSFERVRFESLFDGAKS